LNPKLLSAIFGEDEKDVQKAIEKLCSPDPNSRTEKEDGKRLIRLGQFEYQVVNGAKYAAIRNEQDRRQQLKEAQKRFRDKNKRKKGLAPPIENGSSLTSEQEVEETANEVMKKAPPDQVVRRDIGEKFNDPIPPAQNSEPTKPKGMALPQSANVLSQKPSSF
jgi:hypothetical protein